MESIVSVLEHLLGVAFPLRPVALSVLLQNLIQLRFQDVSGSFRIFQTFKPFSRAPRHVTIMSQLRR